MIDRERIMHGSAYNSENEDEASTSSEEESDWSLESLISSSDDDQVDGVIDPIMRMSSPNLEIDPSCPPRMNTIYESRKELSQSSFGNPTPTGSFINLHSALGRS